MKAKKLIINQVEDISIIEEEINEKELLPRECLVETYVSLISAGTELSRVYGLKKNATYPVYPGYCSVGKVLGVGCEVDHVNINDTVLFSAPHGSHHKFDRIKSDGGVLYKLEEITDPKDGALLMMANIAMNAVLPVNIKPYDTVAIFGLGQLGLITSLIYKQMELDVIVIDTDKNRTEIAREMGFEKVVCCDSNKQLEKLMELTNNEGSNITVDATGISECIETAIYSTAKYGQVILLGSPRVESNRNVTPIFNAIHTKMLNVIGAFNRRFPYIESEGSNISILRNLKYLEKLLNQKIINSDYFISHIIAPNEKEIMEAYKGLMFDKSHYLGVIIDWRKEK